MSQGSTRWLPTHKPVENLFRDGHVEGTEISGRLKSAPACLPVNKIKTLQLPELSLQDVWVEILNLTIA